MSSSDSDASQTQLQESQDNRIAGAGESVNLVASRSTVGNLTVNSTDHGAVDGAFKFGNAAADGAFKVVNAATDSAFKFADQTVNNNRVITDGVLTFAGKAADGANKVINATVDSAFKAIDSTTKSSIAGMRAAQDSSNKLVNAVSDSAFKTTDSTVGKAFKFAESITAGAANSAAASGAQSSAIAKSAMESVKSAYGDATEKVADAWQTSKAGEQKVLAGAVVAIIGLVAVKVFGKGA